MTLAGKTVNNAMISVKVIKKDGTIIDHGVVTKPKEKFSIIKILRRLIGNGRTRR